MSSKTIQYWMTERPHSTPVGQKEHIKYIDPEETESNCANRVNEDGEPGTGYMIHANWLPLRCKTKSVKGYLSERQQKFFPAQGFFLSRQR